MRPAGAGPTADGPPAGDPQGKRRCCARRPQEEVFLNISPGSVHGEGAHGPGHRRSLRIMEAQGHVPLRTDLQVGPLGIMEVGAIPPAEMACGVDAEAAPPTPQVRGQHRQALHPVACISSSRRKRDRPTAVTDVQDVGAGSIAGLQPVGQCQGKRRCRAQRPPEEVFLNTPLPLARHDRHRGMATSATRTGIGASAGITGGARRSRRLQRLPRNGRATSQRGFSASDEASSSAPCILRGLVDVASTPLYEPTTSLHDDGLPFDRGRRLLCRLMLQFLHPSRL